MPVMAGIKYNKKVMNMTFYTSWITDSELLELLMDEEDVQPSTLLLLWDGVKYGNQYQMQNSIIQETE